MDGSRFQKTTLPNGLRILTEVHPHVHSTTLGLWVNAGSVYEGDSERGLAHLLEHMLFKGTLKRSTRQIAVTMDSIGGQLNAFTDCEFVCLHAKVLAEHTNTALELLCDLITHPRLDDGDLAVEKGVIVEEISALEDSPEDLVEDLFTETIWKRSAWGRSTLGTTTSVTAMTADDLRRYMAQHYTPQRVVVAAVGAVDHNDIVRRVEKLLADLPLGSGPGRRQPRAPVVQPHQVVLSRDTEQAHLCCGTRAYSYTDPERFAAWLLDTLLSSGYSSRLFQEIREKRGLCYNIGPISTYYRAAGYWAIETSVAPEAVPRVVDLIGRELRRVKAQGVTTAELKRAREWARANFLLAEESSSAQMSRIARNELYYGEQKSTQETLGKFLAVTREDLQQVAQSMFDSALMNVAAIGPFESAAGGIAIEV